jgi:hyperosmotically inducible protein
MRTLSSAIRVFVVTGLLVMAGLAVGAPNASAGTAVNPDVSAIENQVQHKLAMLPWYGVFDNLQYQVNGTEVILSGQVISEHDTTKSDAENAIKRISGVTKVVNQIEVLPLSSFDNQIRRAEYRTIFSQSDLGRYTMGAIPQVHIVVKNGHVSLYGVVMDQMDKTVAGLAANTVPGVFSVTNNLQIG